MVNHFRADMPRPIVGIGHSLGANMLVNLSFMHARLLSTLVLLDPVIAVHASAPSGPSPAQASTYRRDLWSSRAEAEASFREQKFFQSWDKRVFDRWLKYGIRDTPTSLYPHERGAVTLTTTKHQECFTFMRPSFDAMSEDGLTIKDRTLVPDLNPQSINRYPFYRPEPPNTFAKLDELRPSALYVFGEMSPMSSPEARNRKMEITGMGLGGSGGAKQGRVKEVVLKNVGHLVVMEASGQCADAAAVWLGCEMERFNEEQSKYLQWTKKSMASKTTMSERWKKHIGGPPSKPVKGKI